MFKSRLSSWTRFKCFVSNFPNQESHGKEYCFHLPRNNYVGESLNHVRLIHHNMIMRNWFVRKVPNKSADKNELSHTCIKQLLQKCESVATQIEVFNSHVKLSEEDIADRQVAQQEIENIFKAYFPASSLHMLGSSVTGLGLKGCDVDLSFHFHPDDCKQIPENCSVLSNDIEKGNIPTSMIPALPPKQMLRFLRKALENSGLGGPTATIIPGRCPILNFTHQNLSWDLSINNNSALHGTNIMLLCVKLDKRVAPLFRILIYWAKHSNLVGGIVKFKSYALFLLMVYFLQTRNPPILPSIQKMLDQTEFVANQDNLSYDICKYLGQFDASKNSQSLEELLQEFFFFYGNFNFSTVISPSLGELIDSSVFQNKDGLDNEKFELNSINIQDPFSLDWNVTTGVSWKYCTYFIKGLLSASVIYQKNYYTPSSDRNWGLLALFESQRSFFTIKEKNITIEVPLVLATNMQPEVQKQYLKNAAEITFTVFEHCLNFQCKSDASVHQKNVDNMKNIDEKQSEQVRIENENSFQQQSFPLLLSCFTCTTSHTWFGRSNFQSQSFNHNSTNFLDTEHRISLKLCEEKRDKDKGFHFMCECLGVHEQDRVKLLVNLEAVNSDVFIPKLAIFLKDYIPKCVIKMLS